MPILFFYCKISYSLLPFNIQTKLDNSLLINFCLLSLYQDVKRKHTLMRSNLSAISILTVRSNVILEGSYLPLFFVLLILSDMAKKTRAKILW